MRNLLFRSQPRILVVILCSLATIVATDRVSQASESIVPHEASYKIKISLLGGTLNTVVAQTEDGFTARSVIRPTGFAKLFMRGSIQESSDFTVDADGVRPQIYSSSDTLSKKDKFMDFQFDWANDAVSGKINDEDFVFELDGEVHDRVSLQYELMFNLLNGISGSDYALLDGDKLKQLQVTMVGTKTIKTPFGRFEAIGIQHHEAESTRVSTLWFAEDLGYLPVLIEQHRKGKRRVRAVLTHYTAVAETTSPEK